MRRRALLVLGLALLAGVACKKSEGTPGTSGTPARPRIAVVPKGTTHEFWKSVHAGAVKAAREENVDLVWKGPLKEDDLKAQVDVVSSFVAQGVSGIVLAPLNDTALKAPVHAAKEAKIPVVVFDSDLAGDDPVSFVATDNEKAGGMAADAMAKLLGPAARVVVLRYQEGSASTAKREAGFLDAIKKKPGVTVVSDNQYGGATTESAFAKSESLLVAQKAGEGGVNGVFTPNESTTFGMLQALKKSGAAGKVRFVGFDASDKLVAALRAGEIDALVVQRPFDMGYRALKTMAAHLRGEKIERRIDTGSRVVTKADLEDPAVKELLSPDLARWLSE